jgi:hypothetical protein
LAWLQHRPFSVTVFLVSLLHFSPQTASRLFDTRGVDVIRIWDSPRPEATDFLVVKSEGADALREAVESLDLPIRGVQPMLLRGSPAAGVEDLPIDLPDALADIDLVGWVDPPLIWCDECQTWHAKEHHVR